VIYLAVRDAPPCPSDVPGRVCDLSPNGYDITIRYRKPAKKAAVGPGPYYIDGSVVQPALT